jgi:hypothetical protein
LHRCSSNGTTEDPEPSRSDTNQILSEVRIRHVPVGNRPKGKKNLIKCSIQIDHVVCKDNLYLSRNMSTIGQNTAAEKKGKNLSTLAPPTSQATIYRSIVFRPPRPNSWNPILHLPNTCAQRPARFHIALGVASPRLFGKAGHVQASPGKLLIMMMMTTMMFK